MHTLIWASLLVFVVSVTGGLVLVGVRALAAWRAFRALRRRTGEVLLETTRRVSETEQRLAGAAEAAARLDRARLRLQEGLATAAILAAAAGEARTLVGTVQGVVPRK
jgi:hypothetical protein